MKFIYLFIYLFIGCTPSQSDNLEKRFASNYSTNLNDGTNQVKIIQDLNHLNNFLATGEELSFVIQALKEDFLFLCKCIQFLIKIKNDLNIDMLTAKIPQNLQSEYLKILQEIFNEDEIQNLGKFFSSSGDKLMALFMKTIYLSIFNKIESDELLKIQFKKEYGVILLSSNFEVKKYLDGLESFTLGDKASENSEEGNQFKEIKKYLLIFKNWNAYSTVSISEIKAFFTTGL